MHFDLPFEPIDVFENLENVLPPFASKLSQGDLRNFITFGFVSRRFVLHGRFKPVGHVRAMRSEDDFTAESFLNDPVPPGSNEPLYNGDAVGCKSSKSVSSLLPHDFMRLICFDSVLVNGWSKYYTRHSHLDISDIPDDASITFIYKKPTEWQIYQRAVDAFHNIQYDDSLVAELPTLSTPLDKGNRVFTLLATKNGVKYLIDSFEAACHHASRFGHSQASILAMQRLSWIHRIERNYERATQILLDASTLAITLGVPDNVSLDLQYDLARVYLDGGHQDSADKEFHLIIRKTSVVEVPVPTLKILKTKATIGLADVCVARGQFQQAVHLLLQAKSDQLAYSGSTNVLTLGVKLGAIYRAQGLSKETISFCTQNLANFTEARDDSSIHFLRSLHTLGGVMREEGRLAEAEEHYTRELSGLEALTRVDTSDILRTMGCLAETLEEMSFFHRALDLWRHIVKASTNAGILWFDQFKRLEANLRMAVVMDKMNIDSEATAILESILSQNKDVLGPAHHFSRRTSFILINMYHRKGESSKAEALREGMRSSQNVQALVARGLSDGGRSTFSWLTLSSMDVLTLRRDSRPNRN
jgi:tetratricopeptide (TPR) repeat protein